MTDQIFLAQDIEFCYASSEAALKGASIHIKAGARLAVAGVNGAGKSTLFLALAGLIPATIGRLYIDDCQVLTRTTRDLKKHIKTALLMQDPDHQLIAPSLMQDVMLGPLAQGKSPSNSEQQAGSILKRLGLDGLERRAPHTLSLGQKKKAALAGLLVCEPRLLLLDEPTAGLDGKGTRELLNLLQTCLHPKNAIVIATHDLTFIKSWADEVLVMDKGKTVEQLELKSFLQSRRLLEICGFETEYEEDCTWIQPLASPFPSP
ncbi:MAG: energy-coupling factor ABC transporter ATP-binding protein [Pseudobdellovibrionaceae bacterium]|nr:energy-coupling factor ABC transporter ATP-binding protein [Pseudobdellovibrionaceae bacterium]